MSSSTTWTSFSDGFVAPLLYKDAADTGYIDFLKSQHGRHSSQLELFNMDQSKLKEIKRWSWESIPIQDSGVNKTFREIETELETDDPFPRLLVYSYLRMLGDRFYGGADLRFFDFLARRLSLELDLFLPHLDPDEIQAPDFHRVVRGHRFPSQRTVMHLWGDYHITAQLCVASSTPKKSIMIVIFEDGLQNFGIKQVRLCSFLRIAPWLSEGFNPVIGIRYGEILKPGLMSLPTTALKASSENPFILLKPLIWASAAGWLATLEELRETSQDKIETIKRLENDCRSLRDMRDTIQAIFGGSFILGSTTSGDEGIQKDFNRVVEEYEAFYYAMREELSYEASLASLEESRIGIQQTHSVKRLTQLAFIFIPLSFLTSAFGMNIDVLSGNGAKWWTVLIGALIVYFVLAVPFVIMRVKDSKKSKEPKYAG
ncbi:hypothetical protein B0J11DRAFT_178657 [Dendryphion nanum]|uniref:Uncharacterized protein n=1 Tax=Dendryphion nanum TaxID=256645 RepID=A0A9P9EGE8_9PLEO|nr:hypothetical protein B0J11DRAFT_178657 [Dendryphion nanum]